MILPAMFLRRNRRRYKGETYGYWSLVETVRTARGPRHRLVASLVKLPGLDQQHRHGWDNLANLLDGKESGSEQRIFADLSEQVAPPSSSQPEWREVDIRGLLVERVRDFGDGVCPELPRPERAVSSPHRGRALGPCAQRVWRQPLGRVPQGRVAAVLSC